MKEGDNVVCINDYWFLGVRYNVKGKIYTIVYPSVMNCITSEGGGHCIFNELEFKTYFDTIKEIRRKKLKKINNV